MLVPVNKYLVIKPLEEEERKSGVLVPDDFKANDSAYTVAVLLEAHSESKLTKNTKLLVPSHVVEEVEFFGEKYFIVLENYVVGFFDN